MPQFGVLLTDDSRIVIYDRNMFIVQATGLVAKALSSASILSLSWTWTNFS